MPAKTNMQRGGRAKRVLEKYYRKRLTEAEDIQVAVQDLLTDMMHLVRLTPGMPASWDQIADVQRLQRASGLHQEIVKMFSNDARLADLTSFEPETVEFKRTSDTDLSRRAGRRRRR